MLLTGVKKSDPVYHNKLLQNYTKLRHNYAVITDWSKVDYISFDIKNVDVADSKYPKQYLAVPEPASTARCSYEAYIRLAFYYNTQC